MSKPQYRFDDAYQAVYELSDSRDAYVHIGSYHQFGIKPRMREETKGRLIEEYFTCGMGGR